MQWVCSLRDSLQGLDALNACYPPYEPASHFPTRGRPKGHREAPLLHLQLFKSSTGHSSMQIANRLDSRAVSRLPENNNGPRMTQPEVAVERGWFLWERPSGVHGIRDELTGIFSKFSGKRIRRSRAERKFSPVRHHYGREVSGSGNHSQVGQTVHKKLHGQRHQQQTHDPDKDTDSRFSQYRLHSACTRKHQIADKTGDRN
jgi:hypothetical protein